MDSLIPAIYETKADFFAALASVTVKEHGPNHGKRVGVAEGHFYKLMRGDVGLTARTKYALAAALKLFSVKEFETEIINRPRSRKPGIARAISLRLTQSLGRDAVFEGREAEIAQLDDDWRNHAVNVVVLWAVGGVGKTTLAIRWAARLLTQQNHGGAECSFDWSFYRQGVATGAREETAATASSDEFFQRACDYFGSPEALAKQGWDRGDLLARAIQRHHTLLVLDGLEPFQDSAGRVQDPALAGLLNGLALNNRGLCVVTSRRSLPDLEYAGDAVQQRRLDRLNAVAGAAVLRKFGVLGPDSELQRAVDEVRGHALTLSLMGRYLREVFEDPDIARRDCFGFSEADAQTNDSHAFRVMAAYEQWLDSEGRDVELAILPLLGLFDRPATPDCIAALCSSPALPGLTAPLVDLPPRKWNAAIQRLLDLGLIEATGWTQPKFVGFEKATAESAVAAAARREPFDLPAPVPFNGRIAHPQPIHLSIDTHPILRAYFANRIHAREAAITGHARLFEHLCNSVPYWPEGREGLAPLHQSVWHACKAGMHDCAWDAVYCHRIQRCEEGEQANYSSKKEGLLARNLAAVACFFDDPWNRVSDNVSPTHHGPILSEAGFYLRALNRLSEAREPMRVSVMLFEHEEAWADATVAASNLSELELTLGDVRSAEATAMQSVAFAERQNDLLWKCWSRVTHADALHHAGEFERAASIFAEAETSHAERRPKAPLLYSVQGFKYCDLLLVPVERTAWRSYLARRSGARTRGEIADNVAAALETLNSIEQRATKTLEWITGKLGLLDVATNHLTLGRVAFLRAILGKGNTSSGSDGSEARRWLLEGLNGLREANSQHNLPWALLPLAWLHASAGKWSEARERLDEAYAVSTRLGNETNGWQGAMRLHLADTLLHRARLFARKKPYPWPDRTPKIDLDESSALIAACGNHRRAVELADALAMARQARW